MLDRDPLEPEVWWFGHLIDGDIGKRGRLRHDRVTHRTRLVSGHGGGVYATAALLVHQGCEPVAVSPTYVIYDVATHRLDMRDCGVAHPEHPTDEPGCRTQPGGRSAGATRPEPGRAG